MRLYLGNTLFKGKNPVRGEGDGYTSPSGDQHASGEHRGGGYVARERIGTERDGSPMYRYFRDMESYKIYLQNKGRKKRIGRYGKNKKPKFDDDLEEKVKREGKKHSKKIKRERKEHLDERKLYIKEKKK